MDTSPEAYAAVVARQAASATDDFLVGLLNYATRTVIAGSKAEAISKAETDAVVAEFEKRGLALPFWARGLALNDAKVQPPVGRCQWCRITVFFSSNPQPPLCTGCQRREHN